MKEMMEIISCETLFTMSVWKGFFRLFVWELKKDVLLNETEFQKLQPLYWKMTSSGKRLSKSKSV